MSSVEQRARELLAESLRKHGRPRAADAVLREGRDDFEESLDAIAAALREQPEARGVVETNKTRITLHQDRAGCEWIIVTNADYPDFESEVTPDDDPALFAFLKDLTAAQQPGQEGGGEVCPRCKGAGEYEGFARHASGDPQDEYAATVQCEPCEGTGEVAAPPSAPVGVEAMRRAVEEIESGDFGGGVSDACLSAMKAALTQQPAQAAPGYLTADEREWLNYAIEHMRDDSEPEDLTCADVLEALLQRATPPGDDAAGGGHD